MKKHAKKGSLGDNGFSDKKLNGLLQDDEEDSNEPKAEIKQTKRGPKIDENVQVKICDMGNGCWTYHHFTPEIQTR